MTEVQLKKLLRQLHGAKIQNSLLEESLSVSGGNPVIQPYRNHFQFRIIEEVLNILNQDEKFIIETRLVYHHTWPETMKLFCEKKGAGGERSERTLKRMQSRALKKMAGFINHSLLNGYFPET